MTGGDVTVYGKYVGQGITGNDNFLGAAYIGSLRDCYAECHNSYVSTNLC